MQRAINARHRKRFLFEADLVQKFSLELGDEKFANKFGGCRRQDLREIWDKIKDEVIRSKETNTHARNKLLMWLDKLHNDLSWNQVSSKYQIGVATAVQYVQDLLQGMLRSYQDSNVISFPNSRQRSQMVQLNKELGKRMPNVLYTMDGFHARCKGAHIFKRVSKKYHWKPCFNALFVVDRTFGTV